MCLFMTMIHPFIIYDHLSFAGAYPGWHWVRGRAHGSPLPHDNHTPSYSHLWAIWSNHHHAAPVWFIAMNNININHVCLVACFHMSFWSNMNWTRFKFTNQTRVSCSRFRRQTLCWLFVCMCFIRYRTFVSEDAGPNTLVATVLAKDPDGDGITYKITTGNEEGNFVIDSQKG